jgi:hypothetical protein
LGYVDPVVPDSVLTARVELAKIQRDEVIKAKGAEIASSTIKIPILDDMVPLAGMTVEDTPGFLKGGGDHLEYFFSCVLGEALLHSDSKNKQGYKEADWTNFRDSVYIDGMPYVDFLKKHLPKERPCDATDAKVILTSLINGRHKVDMVNAYRDNNGMMQYEAKNLSVTFTDKQQKMKQGIDARKQMDDDLKRQEEAAYLKQFSWFRRTFFNWGPFRIETLQEKLDRIVNDPNTEDRLAIVTAEQKARIEAGITRQAEKELQAKLEQERDAARREAFEQEAKRVVDSTAQWDKNSAIGILGQQIAGTWKTNNGPVDGVCQAIQTDLATTTVSKRYATIAMPLAKMMLYSQLCSDRAANNGEPGEIEKILGMGDAKTIAESIHNTAAKMAADPILKNLFQDKVGVLIGKEICLDSVKFEEMIGSSGVDRFRMEYMQKLQEMANQKDQQAPTNELEMENQKQQDMQKAPM